MSLLGSPKFYHEAHLLTPEHQSAFEKLHRALFDQWHSKAPSLFQSRPVVRDSPPVMRVDEEIGSYTVLRVIPELSTMLGQDLEGILIRDEFSIAIRAVYEFSKGRASPSHLVVDHEFDEVDEEPVANAVRLDVGHSGGNTPRVPQKRTREEDVGEQSRIPPPSAESAATNAVPIYNPFLTQEVLHRNPRGIIVTGNLGIGKTTWLYYLLVLRMLAGRPTVLQYYSEYLYISTSDGAFRVMAPIYEALSDFLPNDTWCLVDMHESAASVPQHILSLRRFIVQTPSPCKARLRWRDKCPHGAAMYFMKPWSLRELICGRALSRRRPILNERELAALKTQHGVVSARVAYRLITSTEEHDKIALHTLIDRIGMDLVKQVVREISSLTSNNSPSHRLFLLTPGNTRGHHQVTLASRYIYERLRDNVFSQHPQAARALYELFIQNPFARGVAGYLLEDISHAILCAGGRWPLRPMERSSARKGYSYYDSRSRPPSQGSASTTSHFLRLGSGDKQVASISTHLGTDDEHFMPLTRVAFETNEMPTLQDDMYYCPTSPSQATFDAFVYDATSRTVIIFQITVAAPYDVNRKGIERLESFWPAGTKAVYVAVIPLGQQLRIVVPNNCDIFEERYALEVGSKSIQEW